ncbi:MAG TPA: ribose-phosphate diphosphokinase [Methanocorpusculum sp.]|nr:ribose-phosphate diphosphokinase [Methanocorpusculum sp.]
MKIITTDKCQSLATKISQKLNCKILDVKFSEFPDGEQYVRVMDNDNDDNVLIVSSTVDSKSILQTILLIDSCRDKHTTLVLPYMGYARQDKIFNDGEPLSARAIARSLSDEVDQVYTVNIHDTSVLKHFKCPAENLSIAKQIGEYISQMNLSDPIILSPDDGAFEFAKSISATDGDWDCNYMDKTRISGSEIKIAPKNIDANGRDCVIVDDIISTGGSISTVAKMLIDQKASSVRAICVHGLFISSGYIRLMKSGVTDVISSDTIESATSKITASTVIADRIRQNRS